MKREYKSVVDALALVNRARSVFDCPEYTALVTALESRRDGMETHIRECDKARYGDKPLRHTFYSGLNETNHMVHLPTLTIDMPYISRKSFDALKLILHAQHMRVEAPYDVAVVENGITYEIIEGIQR